MRALSTIVLAALAALTLAVQPSAARPRQAARSVPGIVVDVSHLRELGLMSEADLIQATIADEVARTGPYAGRVIVRITGLSLNAFAGSSSFGVRSFGSTGGNWDYLEGDFQVIGPRGDILAGRPMVVNAPASSGGPSYLPGNERRRMEVLARNFAGWIRRYAN